MRLLSALVVLACVACESPAKPPETTANAAAPTPEHKDAPPVAPAGTAPPPPQQAIPAKAYEVEPFNMGPQAEGLVLDVGKTVMAQSGIALTLAPPNRGTGITEWRVKLAKGAETFEVHFEAAELYFEGTAFNSLLVIRDKKENKDQAVVTLRPGAEKPLSEEEAVKLAEAEVSKRGLPRGPKVTSRNDAGVVTVTLADASGEGTQVVVGRYTRSIRNLKPIVGIKRQ